MTVNKKINVDDPEQWTADSGYLQIIICIASGANYGKRIAHLLKKDQSTVAAQISVLEREMKFLKKGKRLRQQEYEINWSELAKYIVTIWEVWAEDRIDVWQQRAEHGILPATPRKEVNWALAATRKLKKNPAFIKLVENFFTSYSEKVIGNIGRVKKEGRLVVLVAMDLFNGLQDKEILETLKKNAKTRAQKELYSVLNGFAERFGQADAVKAAVIGAVDF